MQLLKTNGGTTTQMVACGHRRISGLATTVCVRRLLGGLCGGIKWLLENLIFSAFFFVYQYFEIANA